MTRVALFSDSHGNCRMLGEAVATARAAGAGMLLHLGDRYADMDAVDCGGLPVVRVPGLQCPQYHARGFPTTAGLTLGDLECLLVHDPHDRFERDGIDLVLHGHTHHRECLPEGDCWFLCPGHLKAPRDRGEPAGFALLEVAGRTLYWRFLGPAGGLLGEGTHAFTDRRA